MRTSRRCATATSDCSRTRPSSTPGLPRGSGTPPARRPEARPDDGRHGPIAPTRNVVPMSGPCAVSSATAW
jgi:hypothetical protein